MKLGGGKELGVGLKEQGKEGQWASGMVGREEGMRGDVGIGQRHGICHFAGCVRNLSFILTTADS